MDSHVETYRPGDLVKIRAFRGQEVTRLVKAVRPGLLLVCREEEYEDARRRNRPPVLAGCKLEHVLGKIGHKRLPAD